MRPDPSTKLRASAPVWARVALGLLLLWAGANRIWLASEGLEVEHYADERYGVKNTRAALAGDWLDPINYFYTGLSFLPQAALFASIEAVSRLVQDEPFEFFAEGPLHPEGYRLARLVQIAYALAGLYLTFVVGRRLFSIEVGLLAALLLTVTLLHVRLSTIWKPDVLLLLFVLATLLWSFDALERPTLGRYLLAGCGVGLALASKLNGGPIAVPLTVGAVTAAVLDWRSRRRSPGGAPRDRGGEGGSPARAPLAPAARHALGLFAAGFAAVAVFLVFNPNVGRYFDTLVRNQSLYRERLDDRDLSVGDRLVRVATDATGFVLSRNFHGFWIGLVALAGMVAVALVAARQRDRLNGFRALAILVFPLGYMVIYALGTPFAKENNFLPILPFTALAAAFLLVGAWKLLAARLPERARWPTAALATAALVFATAAPTQAWIYETRVPTTWDRAIESLTARLRPWDGRVVYLEAPRTAIVAQKLATQRLLRRVDELSGLAGDFLDRVDAEAFPAQRLDAEDGAFHRERVARFAAGQIRRYEPRWFRLRGPTVITIFHPMRFEATAELTPKALGDGRFGFDTPVNPGEWLSVKLSVERRALQKGGTTPRLFVGERLLHLDSRRTETSWVSERFPSEGRPLIVELAPRTRADSVGLIVFRWR